ncbi:MAG TPA: polysaccharide biosynthesis/export family protein [Terracidiphilus sp.]|nr:polysaccharide biosynthesis/export family protein [Terracidiphilus sp.]
MNHKVISLLAVVALWTSPWLYAQTNPDIPPVRQPSADTSQSSSSSMLRTGPAYTNSTSDPLASDIAQDTQDKTSLSADRIISILQDHPVLLANAKRMVAVRMQAQGDSIPAGITDEELFNLIDENEDLRAAFTQQLSAQGFLTREDRDELGESEEDNGADGSSRKLTPSHRARSRSTVRNDAAMDPNAPSAISQPDPYPDVPALHDLYSQARPQKEKLNRFGFDVFSDRGTLLDSSSLDQPVGPDYVLGPGDRVSVGLSGGVSQRLTRTVDREGKILLPEAGVFPVTGKTISEAQQLMQQTLTPYFHDVKVDVSLTHIRTVRVYVVGEVQKPGAYDVSSLSTPLNA